MLRIGSHISSAKGYAAMGHTARRIGATTFAFFLRNPRGGNAKALDEKDVAVFLGMAAEDRLGPLVAHAPYTMNACSQKENIREFSRMVMDEDLKRLAYTPGNYYNFHPGGAGGQDKETCFDLIADQLNRFLTADMQTVVLLETMSGKGSEIGGSFEELREVLGRVERTEKVGVCLDTCHVWDAGYDIVSDLDGVLTRFDRAIGLERLRAVHVNDSKNPLGSRKDRHAKLGEGEIGLSAIVRVINHEALRGLPFVLETPNDEAGWAREIALLKERYRGD